eukprot:1825429-Amphidinium_carterae.1
MYNAQGVPTGSVPHHYVNYYVSLHPNPDAAKIKKAKPFRERKSPYADTVSDMKRPFGYPRDMPIVYAYRDVSAELPEGIDDLL